MHEYEVAASQEVFHGRVVSVRTDHVRMPDGGTGQRDVVVHPGAVAVVALRGEGAGAEVLLVSQYRHPVGRRLEELPAGLLDVTGEVALEAARRELAEEAGLRAGTWNVLVDVLSSPGMTDEAVRVYLARDLTPTTRDVQEHEEVELTTRWVRLADAVGMALSGELENATAVAGVLAAAAAGSGRDRLRPPDAPWRSRPSAVPRT